MKNFRDIRTIKQDNQQTIRNIKYYNPIKGEEYEKGPEISVSGKYDYN